MDAPEKIYLQQYDENKLICLNKWNISDEWTLKPFNVKVATNIEYVRIDAFIEKALRWMINKNGVNDVLSIELVDDFKEYMKG